MPDTTESLFRVHPSFRSPNVAVSVCSSSPWPLSLWIFQRSGKILDVAGVDESMWSQLYLTRIDDKNWTIFHIELRYMNKDSCECFIGPWFGDLSFFRLIIAFTAIIAWWPRLSSKLNISCQCSSYTLKCGKHWANVHSKILPFQMVSYNTPWKLSVQCVSSSTVSNRWIHVWYDHFISPVQSIVLSIRETEKRNVCNWLFGFKKLHTTTFNKGMNICIWLH